MKPVTVSLLNICNTLKLSGLFVCPGELARFFRAWGKEKIAGLWFVRGEQYPG